MINKQAHLNVCAIVTTYSPDDGFPDRIAKIQSQVQCVVIVNDSASAKIKERLARWFTGMPCIVLMHQETNRGIAAALNTGMEWAGTMGFAYAILFDDDSIISPGMVNKMVSIFEKHPNYMSSIVAVSQNFKGKASPNEITYQVKEVSSVITAGSMIPLEVFQTIGLFREELFIDYVDHEYCLRAKLKGVRILECVGASIGQPIGQSQKTALGELRSIHSPLRNYYFFRNSFAVACEYFWRFPEFAIWSMWQQFKGLVKILFFLRPKRQYLLAMILGWRDGCVCRFGRIPDDVRMQLL